MKIYKCPNCHNEKQKDDDIMLVMCGCGYCMDEIVIPKVITKINEKPKSI